MTSDQIEAAPTPAQTDPLSRRVRLLLWTLGLCLWVLAVVGVYATWRARQAAEAQAASAAAAGAQAGDSAEEGLKAIVLDPSDDAQPPATVWDPKGIEDFALTERSGRTVTKQDLLGKPWAVSFIFTRCAGSCLDIGAKMHELQKGVRGADVRLVSISVDPKVDTPEQLRKWADAFGADPERWLFLTGEEDEIYRLIQQTFRLPVAQMTGENRKAGFEVAHSNFILHVNAAGVVVGKYSGTDDAEMVKLRRALVNEARELQATNRNGE